MQPFRCFMLVLVLTSGASAAFNQFYTTPLAAATAYSSVAAAYGTGLFPVNPALGARLNQWYAQVYYSRLFSLKELQTAGLVVGGALNNHYWGLHVSSFGYSLYRENLLQLNYARQWDRGRLAAGASVQVYYVNIARYGSRVAVGMNLGIFYQASSSVSFGGVVMNVNEPRLSGTTEQLPYVFAVGVSVHPVKQGEIVAAISKESDYPVEYRIGFQYRLNSRLAVYSGYTTSGPQPTGGIQLRVGNWHMNYVVQYHFLLGATHLVGVTFGGDPW